MPKLDPLTLANASSDARELLQSLAAQRGYIPNLYATLAHSPGIARAFLAVVEATRTETTLDPLLREFTILAIARESGATIQWLSHLPIARAAGATPAQLASLAVWEGSPEFSELERAILSFAREVARAGQPTQTTWEAVRDHLDDRQVAELAFFAAFYSGVSRLLNTLAIEPDAAYLEPAIAAFARAEP